MNESLKPKFVGVQIVVPLYNESHRINMDYWNLMVKLPDTYWLFINDGSTDETGKFIEKLAEHKNVQSFITLGALRSLITLFIFLPILYKIFKYRKQINNLELFTYIIFITLFMPGVTYAYYLTLFFVPLLIGAVIWESGIISDLNFLFRSKLLKYIGATSLILLFIPWTIPWSMIFSDSSNKFTLTGINWLPGIVLLQIYFIGTIWSIGKVSQNNIRGTKA